MENIRRSIRLFFVYNGKLLFAILGIIAIIIAIIQGLNSLAKIENKEKQEQLIIQEKKEEEENTDKEIITKFIDYCRKNNVDEAYKMLSDECKTDKFISIEKFTKEYVEQYFNIDIVSIKITKDENSEKYIVKLKENELITGKINTYKETKIKLIENVLETKIFIES